jgi:formate-dependent nitrite reductase membrane component NrfD
MKNLMILPSERQETWTWPAVAMFTLVGMGAGLYLSSALLNLLSGDLRLFGAVPISYGPAACLTVILGFLFVMGEAGRPLRGHYVLSNVKQSWMSREILFLSIFILTVFIDYIVLSVVIRVFSLVAAFMLILCQGFIIYGSRGITAWNKAFIPLLFLSSGLSSGYGLLFLIPDVYSLVHWRVSALTGSILLALSLVISLIYLYGSRNDAFRIATESLRNPFSLVVNMGLGGVLPLFLLLFLLNSPEKSNIGLMKEIIVLIAGITMVFGGISQKASIIMGAGFTRGIFLSREEGSIVQRSI